MPRAIYNLQFEQPRNNSLGAQLKEIINFLIFIDQNPKAENLILNLRKISFVHPLFVLSLASITNFIRSYGIRVSIDKKITEFCSAYLKAISFPDGIRPDKLENWENILRRYENRNYMPIINFPSDKSDENSTIRENLISQINHLINTKLQLSPVYETAVSYLISEITDNIIEHAGNDRGWLMVQYYPNTLYLDICIIDNGKTILGSYQDHGISHITSDITAVEKALLGISTKGIERGTGLRSSKAISINGLAGDFALFSGHALFYKNRITHLPVAWPGTFVAIRIKKGVENFSIYNYI